MGRTREEWGEREGGGGRGRERERECVCVCVCEREREIKEREREVNSRQYSDNSYRCTTIGFCPSTLSSNDALWD